MSHSTVVIALLLAIAGIAAAQTSGTSEAAAEMNSLNFDTIIGGPLVAVINAQKLAAQTTVDYINQIGFEEDADGNSVARMVSFGYSGVDENGAPRDGAINVPLLTIVPIPYLRFDTADVEFNVKINQQSSTSKESATSVGVSASVSAAFQAVTVDVTASVSHQSKSSSSSSIQREYSTRVFVHAVQAEMPEGMSKVLDKLLEIAYTTNTGGSARRLEEETAGAAAGAAAGRRL